MKQTEIGLIPDDWEVKSLGEIGEPCMCKRILKEQTSPTGDIPFYKIGTFGGIPDAYISRELFEQYKEQYNYPKKGTLLLSAAGTIGRVVVFDGKDSYFQDSNIVWIDNDETKVTNDFLFYCYSRMQWKTEEGGIVSRLYNANLKSTSFIAPKSLAEQERIAKALSDVDALISTTEKLIQKKMNIKQGAMQNLLTGKKRLPGFGPQTKYPTYKQTELGLIPEDWEVMSLGEFCQIKDGTHGTYARVENGYLLLSAKNILNGKLDIQESESLISENAYKEIVKNGFPKKKDLLISCVGTIGRCCIFDTDEEIAFQRSVAFIRQNQIDNLFLMYFIQSDLFQKQLREAVNASTLGGVYLGAFNPLQISFSSDKKEQTAIASVLSSMDKEIGTLNTKLEKYRNLKTAMMQQLLTGKIRLIK